MKTRIALTLVGVMALLVGVLAPVTVPAAVAGPGSLVNGTVWADANRNGLRDTGEPARAGVTVQLLSSPAGTVVGSLLTNASGAYAFSNLADGSYTVRVDAPGAFRFPDSASGTNDFARVAPTVPGDPERGISAPFTIAGGTRVTALDAGLQPLVNLQVQQLAFDGPACEGIAETGTPPFDAAEGPGMDTGIGNCIVRTGDTVRQQFGVSLTGLQGETVVQNVVLELTVSSPDGAVPAMTGTGPGGAPAACLTSAVGANPSSSTRTNPDGSITVTCNLGPASSTVTVIDFYYRVTNASAIPSHMTVTAHAYAAQGDAGVSNTVTGPLVEVTGSAEWDLTKRLYPQNQYHQTGPDYTELEVPGVGTLEGYEVTYQFDIQDTGLGGGQLAWPVTFTDVMPEFPNARVIECRHTNLSDAAGRSFWTLGCPSVTEVQGADGWELSIRPNPALGNPDYTHGHMVMRVFIPVDEMNRAIDPDWEPGDAYATGQVVFDNIAQDTDHWAMAGGQLNTGEDPTNNTATLTGAAAPPQWDLQKNVSNTITYATRDIGGGTAVPGYDVLFTMTVIDLAGAANIAPWLDRPVEFRDRLVSHPGAHLIECTPLSVGTGGATATPTCETGLQPADGWDMSLVPTEWGLDSRRGDFWVRVFIPMDAMELDPCNAANPQLRVRNEAIDSEGWTAGGPANLNNGTGFEPGWDGTTATGNNVVDRTIVIPPATCGTYSGNKVWENGPTLTYAGRQMGTSVAANANNDRVAIEDLTVCDVFDVSVLSIVANAYGNGIHALVTPGGTINAADFIVEYAEGPNETRTQAPVDYSSIQNAARDCHTYDGPWEVNPASFGADWQDTVNMIRVRPIDPDHVQVGPFALNLRAQLVTRGVYNGGPNDGELIPSGVNVTNVGGWTTRGNPDTLSTITRQVPFRGMTLAIGKAAVQAQYLPGNTAVWNIAAGIDQATVGATMLNVRVVDTLPPALVYDATCTQGRLPAGVTATYNPEAHVVTFLYGDVPVTTGGRHWIAGGGGIPHLQVCTTVSTLAQPGDLHRNNVQVFGDNSENAPTATAQIQITGSGQMGITKRVDKTYVASGEQYEWAVEWGNTSTTIAFSAPDVIDVLPWNGDGAAGSGSQRTSLPSSYQGVAELTGPLGTPTYARGGTGVGTNVAGTWYYSTAAPATLNHDPRNPANANPAAPGGLWLTAAEVADFADVTAVRFVHDAPLTVQSRVLAVIPVVSISNQLGNLYVNRAMITSATVPDQPLLSNEPYVLMPGFTLGDLVWLDANGNGRFDAGETGVPGVTVQVRDDDGGVVDTLTTDTQGRWSAQNLFAGTYTVHIPATMFAPGGPLAGTVVRTFGSSADNGTNEGVDNNNTATANPINSGLTSSPMTLANVRNAGGTLTGGNGPTGDDVARLGNSLLPDSFTNFTVDLALMGGPGIDIEKSTNGQDADTPTGPNVSVGGEVRWTYLVTNTGDVDLTNIVVTDDMVAPGLIDCNDTGTNVVAGPLAPNASFSCVATGTAIAGQYDNMGTATGLDPTLVEVTDEDPSHYFGIVPEVDIEKATNGQDADTPTGPLVTLGEGVRWTYVVTNTGNAPLSNVTVTDDMLDPSEIDCSGTGSNVIPGPLAPGSSFTCVANGIATLGQYANLGSVVATGPETTDVDGNPVAGVPVDDGDPSHYFGVAPAVDIEKATNGQDADTPTGPNVAVNGDVRWTYVVTNTGNVPLTNVTVTDDQVAAAEIDCDGTGSNVIAGPLAPGGSFECVAEGTATAGQYANTGTVVGTGPGTTDVDGETVAGQPVTDADPSHYFGVAPAVDIEKATNGQDADTPTGPYVTADGPVRWTYVVTNTGNVPLTNITVTDDMIPSTAILCLHSGTNVIPGPLEPGASVNCAALGVATPGQYANLGSVTAVGPDTTDVDGDTVGGVTVEDDDPSHYFGALPSIDIEKATNGQDADTPTGPSVNVDGAVRWTYTVTNTGNVPLTNVTVTDDMLAAGDIDCDGTGSNVVAGPLAAGDSFSCVANGTAVQGQYANLGSVVGTAPPTTDVNGEPVPEEEVTDGDPSHYLGIAPAVDIEKLTNGEDADEPTGPVLAVGAPVEWRFVVTNTGDVPLTNVTVTDDRVPASAIDCAETGTNVIPGTLVPGDSYTCIATGIATAGQYANLGTVTGTGPATTGPEGEILEGEEVTDLDWSHYLGAVASVDLEKHTNGEDADTAPGVPLTVGEVVEWTYIVTNTGTVPLANIIVTDDKVAAAEVWCDGTESNVVAGPLAPGESFECNALGVAVEGSYTNMGTVVADAPLLQATVTGDDPSHYTASPPAPSAPPATGAPAGLPSTGVAVAVAALTLGALLALLGALLFAAGRRRRA